MNLRVEYSSNRMCCRLAQMLHHHSQRPQVGHTSLSGLIAAFYSVFGLFMPIKRRCETWQKHSRRRNTSMKTSYD